MNNIEQKFKSYIIGNIVVEGWGINFCEMSEEMLADLSTKCLELKAELEQSRTFSAGNGGDLLSSVKELKELVYNENLDWDDKYNEVFGNLNTKIENFIGVDYYDPEGSYEEDVMAYYHAVKSHIEDEYL
jgi:hypothetical protein